MAEQEKYYASFSEIIPNLFLGNSDTAYDYNVLQILDVSHILVVGEQLEIKHPQNFIYKKISISDSIKTNLIDHLEQGMNFIQQGIKSKGVLVHCQFGISRSSAFVIAYLMKSKCQPFLMSYKEVKRKRDLIKPNSGFTKQLMSFETKLKIKQ